MRSKRAFLFLLVLSVVVHACAIAWVYGWDGRIDAYAFNSLDCGEYFSIARNIIQNGAFSQNESAPFTPDTWRTPGYPLFLAAGMLLVGNSATGLIVVQHLVAISSVLLFFKIASRHMAPKWAGLATLIFLLEPYHLFYAFWLLSTTFFTFMLLVTWWIWERARANASLWHYSVLGLLTGFLVLIWPGALLIPFCVIVGLLRSPSLNHQNRKIATVVISAVACLIPPITWMSRNKFVAGHFALSHQSGIVLAYFKATEVELWRQGRTEDRYVETSLNPDNRDLPHAVWDEIDQTLCARMTGLRFPVPFYPLYAEKKPFILAMPECKELEWEKLAQGNKTQWDSFEVSRELGATGLYILGHSIPATIGCGLTRIVENLVFPLGLALKPAREVPLNPLKATVLGTLYAGLAVAGCVGLIRARKNWSALYFPTACIIALAVTTTPQVDPRFRVPMIPLLAFLAFFPALRAES